MSCDIKLDAGPRVELGASAYEADVEPFHYPAALLYQCFAIFLQLFGQH